MKKTFLFILFSILVLSNVNAQKFNDLINLQKYKEENTKLTKPVPNERRIVFIGNSITEGWAHQRPDFFTKNNFIGRGISGQTSPQLLSRFRRDVVELNPITVVINIGTNDIAENTGTYDEYFTLGNIKSMADIAIANNIQVVLSSVLPAKGFGWNEEIKNVPEKIISLNKKIEEYATSNNFIYVDYYSHLKDENGALPSNLSNDGVHPNGECYELMETIVLSTLGIQ